MDLSSKPILSGPWKVSLGRKGNTDKCPQVTGYTPKASVGGFILGGFLDDPYSLPEDNQSMTQRAAVGGVYLGYICLDQGGTGGV